MRRLSLSGAPLRVLASPWPHTVLFLSLLGLGSDHFQITPDGHAGEAPSVRGTLVPEAACTPGAEEHSQLMLSCVASSLCALLSGQENARSS